MHGKEKDFLKQIQELFCLREFVVSYDPGSAPQTAKKSFFLKVTRQGDFGHLKETANLILSRYWLVLVDNKLRLNCMPSRC